MAIKMRKGPWKYIKNYKFNSLFLKNFLLILGIIVVPIWGFSIAVYFYFHTSFESELENTADINLKRLQEVLDTTQTNIQVLCRNLASDSLITEYMKKTYHRRITWDEAKELQQLMRNVRMMSNDYVESVYLYSEKNKYIVYTESVVKSDIFHDMNWLDIVKEKTKYGGICTWGREREEKTFSQNNMGKTYPCITTGISVPVVYETAADGYIIINLDDDWIDRLVSDGSRFTTFFVVDKSGNVIYNSDATLIGTAMPSDYCDNDKYIINESDFNIMGWKYIYIMDRSGVLEKEEGLLKLVIAIVILSTLAAIVLAWLISFRVFLPVKNIIEMIDNPLEFYDMHTKQQGGDGSTNELKYIMTAFMQNLNCIRHGFTGRESCKSIIIEGERNQNTICFLVMDNGVGMEEAEVESLNRELQTFRLMEGKHIGIRNVNQRVKMLFGGEYGITLYRMEPGLKVEVKIPLMKKNEGQNKMREKG